MNTITWVIKFSKYCNLRCSYCYEWDSLALKDRIDTGQLLRLFSKIRDISAQFDAQPRICWHGGEPLLLPPSYAEAVFRAQQAAFADNHSKPTNTIQTNLTALGSQWLNLLPRFDHVSISFDVAGSCRVAANGRDTQRIVLQNMAVLRNAGIDFGAINVLSQKNLDSIDRTFRFFNETQVSFRVLPIYRSANAIQLRDHGISQQQILDALLRIMDLWFQDSSGIRISPITEYVLAAISFLQFGPRATNRYNKATREFVYIVDTSGDVFSVADTYDPRYCHGNIFRDSVSDILGSPGRQLAIRESQSRLDDVCATCRLWGACHGFWVGEATPVERVSHNGKTACIVARNCIERAVQWLRHIPTPQWPRSGDPDDKEQFVAAHDLS